MLTSKLGDADHQYGQTTGLTVWHVMLSDWPRPASLSWVSPVTCFRVADASALTTPAESIICPQVAIPLRVIAISVLSG